MRGKASMSLMFAAITMAAVAETWYVSPTGNDTADGQSAASAFKTVAKGVLAAGAGDVVEVAAGTYNINEQILVEKAITVRGATGNPDDVIINNTKADGVRRIFQLGGNARVESMTLQNGFIKENGGNNAGSIIHMHDAVVTNCVLQGGSGGADSSHSVGVWMEGTSETLCRLENSVIRNNYNREGDINEPGGGVYVHTFGTVSGCMVSNNYSRTAGGGVAAKSGATAIFKDCVIYDNYGGLTPTGNGYGGGSGGGLRGTYINCLIVGNHSWCGNGNHSKYGSVTDASLYCCTVIDNEYTNKPEGGLYNCTAYNTIIYNNTGNSNAANDNYVASGNGVSALYSCCTVPESTNTASNKGGNVWADPQFQSKTVPANLTAAYRGFEYPFDPMNFAVYGAGSYEHIHGATVDLVGEARADPPDIGCVESISVSENIVVTSITTADRRSASVNVVLTSRGSSAATRATVTVVISASEDMSELVFTDALTFTKDLDSQVLDTGNVLEPETIYYVRVSIANDASQTLVLPIESFMTLNERVLATIAVDGSCLPPSVSVAVEDFGLAAKLVKATVRLWDNADRTGEPLAVTDYTLDFSDTASPYVGLFVNGITGLESNTTYWLDLLIEDDLGRADAAGNVVAFTTPSAGDNVWANTGTDMTEVNSYLYNFVPGTGNTVYFESPASVSPVVESDLETARLYFGRKGQDASKDNYLLSYDYTVTGSGSLTLSGSDPVYQRSAGTNEVSVPLHLTANNPTITAAYGDLWLKGPVTVGANATLKLYARSYGILHLAAATPDYNRPLQLWGGAAGCIAWEDPGAYTGATSIALPSNWGWADSTGNYTGRTLPNWGNNGKAIVYYNNTGVPLVFPNATTITFGGEGIIFAGGEFVFPEATLNGDCRNVLTIKADVAVKNYLRSGDNILNKAGAGILTITDEFQERTSKPENNFAHVGGGCFYPASTAAWGPLKSVRMSTGTLGITSDYTIPLDGSHEYKMVGASGGTWGWTAMAGEPEVKYVNADGSLWEITTASQVAYATSDNAASCANTEINSYYIKPTNFRFGNRSTNAKGTVRFMNPVSLNNTDHTVYCESAPHVVAARLMAPWTLSSGKSLTVYGDNSTNIGGILAIEGTTDMLNHIVVKHGCRVLMNGTHSVAKLQAESSSGIGGTGSYTASETKLLSGTYICGGEWGKGGTLTINGPMTFDSGSEIRVEIPANGKVGSIRLANTDTTKSLSIGGPIKVRLDLEDLTSMGRVKVLDWKGAEYKNGRLPELDDFEAVFDEAVALVEPRLTIVDDALYIRYRGAHAPNALILTVR